MIDIKNLRLVNHDLHALEIVANKDGSYLYFHVYQIYVEASYMFFGNSPMKYYSPELFATEKLAMDFFENELLPHWKRESETGGKSLYLIDFNSPYKVKILAQKVYLV